MEDEGAGSRKGTPEPLLKIKEEPKDDIKVRLMCGLHVCVVAPAPIQSLSNRIEKERRSSFTQNGNKQITGGGVWSGAGSCSGQRLSTGAWFLTSSDYKDCEHIETATFSFGKAVHKQIHVGLF